MIWLTGCLFGVFQFPRLSRTALILSSLFEIATIPDKIEIISLILSNVDHNLSHMKQHGRLMQKKHYFVPRCIFVVVRRFFLL